MLTSATLFVGAAALLLALIEGSASAARIVGEIRAIGSETNFRKAKYDTLLGWIGQPAIHVPDMFARGVGLTNNVDGMRIHRPVQRALASGMRRIICSGDSFTHGWGVGDSDTFCADLEAILPRVETLNMAQPGYGIDQAYLWYKRDGAQWPHQLHLFAFIWNDFERMTMRNFSGYNKPILRVKDGRVVAENTPVPRVGGSGVSNWSYAARVLQGLRLMQLLQRRTDNSDRAKLARTEQQIWTTSESVFRDLDALNKARGSQLVLLYLPTRIELVPGPLDARRARLTAFATGAGLTLIDLTEEMRRVPADSSQWFFITNRQLAIRRAATHYTTLGHHWVAEAIARRLRDTPSTNAVIAANRISATP